ncbi:MAG: hypothetical protein FJZ08_01430 [Candidatus Omnitrophica bacterium]|nr:hypothetical protein [Candidatus Omnitrophota bacterium]
MKKILISILALSICAVVLVVVARNFIVKMAVTQGIEALAGVKVQVQKINIGLLSPSVGVDSLKIYNPSGFAGELMADIPQIYVNYDLWGLLGNRVHLKKVKIEIEELAAVLNEQGKLNFSSLALLMPKPGGAKPPEVKIDELFLKIGRVGYKTMQFNLNFEETFYDVTDPSKVAGDILKKILSRIGIEDLAKIDIKGQAANIKQSANKILDEGVKDIKSAAEDIESSAKISLDKTKEDLKNIFSQ